MGNTHFNILNRNVCFPFIPPFRFRNDESQHKIVKWTINFHLHFHSFNSFQTVCINIFPSHNFNWKWWFLFRCQLFMQHGKKHTAHSVIGFRASQCSLPSSMCITARWFWTLYCVHCIQWICSAQLAQYNNRMTAVRNKNNSTNVMAINIYCYYSLNAIWQAVEWTVFFFSLLRRTMHKLICIYEMREATSNSNEMKIKSPA